MAKNLTTRIHFHVEQRSHLQSPNNLKSASNDLNGSNLDQSFLAYKKTRRQAGG
jgi:hypothetical protein